MKSKKQWKIAVILLFVVVCGAFYLRIQDSGGNLEFLPENQYVSEEQKETDADEKMSSGISKPITEDRLKDESEETPENTSKKESLESADLMVHVCGEVVQEGVYCLPVGARVIDAIEAAGGFTKEAARTYFNQAERLEDGIQLNIPSQKEVDTWKTSGQTLSGLQSENSPWNISDSSGVSTNTKANANDGRIDLNRADKETLMTLPGIGESKAEAILSYREINGSFTSIEELMEIPGIKEGVFHKIKERIMVERK